VITIATFTRAAFAASLQRSLRVILLLSLVAIGVNAQSETSSTDGATPLGNAPGAPAGSYSLSGFDTVNLYNGHLNFLLPLLRIGGRGSAQMTMALPVKPNSWRVKHSVTIDPTTGLEIHTYYPQPNWWTGIQPGYGPGVLQGRSAGMDFVNCSSDPNYKWYFLRRLTRLTFTAGDGTEYELRDQLTGGQVSEVTNGCTAGASRGTTFVTADGSAATFVSDTTIYDANKGPIGRPTIIYPSGYLMLRDGARYRIDNGLVSWMRDRNGNKLSFTYDVYKRVTSITDSLNRQVAVNYDVTDGSYGLCDQIIFKGYGGAQRIIRVSKTNLGSALRSGYSLGTYASLFPELNGSSSTTYDPTVVSSVWLPDGTRRYQLQYNSYGEVARVTLPTDGAIEYDYTTGSGAITDGYDYQIYRRVTARRVYPDGSTLEGKTSYSATISGPSGQETTTVTLDYLNPGNALLSREKHYYNGSPTRSLFQEPLDYEIWNDGKENQTESFAANGTTALRRVAHNWQQGCPVSGWSSTIPNNPRIADTTGTLVDTNQVSKQTFSYDCYNNQTDVREFDYGAGAPPTYATRHTHTDYLTSGYDTNTNIHLRSLPSQQLAYSVNTSNGTETLAAQTNYEYDLYDTSANHAPLVNRSGISGLDSGFTTGYTTRGNVTKVSRWLNSPSGWIYTYAQYDIAGNVVKAIDGRGYATDFEFNDRFGAPTGEARANTAPSELAGLTSFAFPTKVTNALGQTSYTQFDYYLGKPVDAEDANGVVSSGFYNEALDRPTQVIRANTASPADSNKNQTTFAYNDASRLITTTSDRDGFGDNLLKSEVFYDGLGRTIEARRYSPGPAACTSPCYSLTKTTYDAMGRTYQVSNPYWRNESPIWTTTTYDALSRVASVATPDGATVATAYDGARVLVTDQAGKRRISQTDALGRLTNVWEITAADSATESVSFPNYPAISAGYRSKYVYNALDNLTTVTQQIGTGGTTQTRSFAYDSLKRLTSATNPESGTTSYVYDGNGNLTSKTDARSIVTTINYDAVNRPTSKSYTGGTATVNYYYDAQTLPTGAPSYSRGSSTGRLVAVAYGGGSLGNYYGYDSLGRVTIKYQRTGTTNYQALASYNKAGVVTGGTYPSGRTVTYSYDGAGRLDTFRGNLGDGTWRTYAKVTQYAAAGLKERESYGVLNGVPDGLTTPLYLKLHYNNRLQMVDLRLGAVQDEWNYDRGALIFYYGAAAVSQWNPFANSTDNNGNVVRQVNYVPRSGASDVIPQLDDYAYDSLNRISGMTEWQLNESGAWVQNVVTQSYSYDRYGNRCVTSATGGVSNYCPTYNATNNRIGSLTYDAAGNITYDALTGGTMTYDAENRMLTATSGGGGSYTYDGEGKRVKRVTAGQEWWYVYGIGGELVAEYLSTAPTTVKKEYGYRGGQLLVVWDADKSGNEQMKWLMTDHLGSTRMEADKSGSLAGMRRHDYAPFGEEMYAGIRRNGGGQGQYGYEPPQSNVRMKFDAKERDIETGLDFFGARYFSSMQGRFTSADPIFFQKEMPADPQRFNLYAYVRNNPLKYIDPKGEAIELIGDEKQREAILEALKKALGKAGAYLYVKPPTKDGRYFVGIYTNGPDGKGPAFDSINAVSKVVGKIIGADSVAQVRLWATGSDVPTYGGTTRTIGPNYGENQHPAFTDPHPSGEVRVNITDPASLPSKFRGITNYHPDVMEDYTLGAALLERRQNREK
jgi:RHS repeat-associated protein